MYVAILMMILIVHNISQISEPYQNRESKTHSIDFAASVLFEGTAPLENENFTSFPKMELRFTPVLYRLVGGTGNEAFPLFSGIQVIAIYFHLFEFGLICVIRISQKCLITRHHMDGEK